MFKINVDPSFVCNYFQGVSEKQIPFAVSLGLNRVANIAQSAERDHIRKAFHLRRDNFIMAGVYISKTDRARKDTWSVTIRIQGDRDFLNRTEDGTTRFPTKGKWLWKPNSEVFGDQIISRANALNPHNLQFDANGRGPERTFMVKGNGSKTGPLVLQRTGAKSTGYSVGNMARDDKTGRFTHQIKVNGQRKRSQGVRLLYTLVARTHTPVKLEFVSTIRQTVGAAWEEQMQVALVEAERTAR